ncbi:MAG: polysaccharide pyruvyl transferase family protein, partial [Bacteroidota bacterium]
VVLGMRLHALIFAALAGVPPVGLAYDPKVTAFLARLGLAEMALPLDAGSGEVWRAMAAAREARGSIEARLAESVARLREAALLNAVRVRELLAGPAAGAGGRAAKA